MKRTAGKPRPSAFPPGLRLALYVFAIALLVALCVDLCQMLGRARRSSKGLFPRFGGDPADLRRGLQENTRYVDPRQRFSLVAPRGWQVARQPQEGEFDVVFLGPGGMDLSIQCVDAPDLTLLKLRDQLQLIEKRMEANTHLDVILLGEYKGFQRTCQLFRNKVTLVDFLHDGRAHHLQFSAPPALHDEYYPVMLDLLKTYKAL